MYNTELKNIIDNETIVVAENDCYLAIAKVEDNVSVCFEGRDDVLVSCLYELMKKYAGLRDIILETADIYDEE